MIRRRMDDERLFGSICAKASSNQAPIEYQGRFNTRPSLCSKNNSLQGHAEVTFDFVNRVFSANVRIRERPKDSVQGHEK